MHTSAKTPEDRLLAWLESRAAGHAPDGVLVGPGDDAAVLALAGRWVVTVDSVIEGIDFTPTTAPRLVGFKAMASSISDVAAMGASPRYALDSLALGPGLSEEDAREIFLGLEDAAKPYGVTLVGGDISASPGPTMVAVTVLGVDVCGRVLTRSGARPGDEIWATGAFGGSILGRHLRPTPRVAFALAANRSIPLTAAIDVSDGLAKDLLRLAGASGVGVRLELARVPVHSDAAVLAATSGRPAIEHALSDGEDYELVMTARPGFEDAFALAARETGTPVTRVGLVTGGGYEKVQPDGSVEPLESAGWGHDWTRTP